MSYNLELDDIRSLGASRTIQSFFASNNPKVIREDDGTFSIHSHKTLQGLSEDEAMQALIELAVDFEY